MVYIYVTSGLLEKTTTLEQLLKNKKNKMFQSFKDDKNRGLFSVKLCFLPTGLRHWDNRLKLEGKRTTSTYNFLNK